MNIAFVVEAFPELSETFILRHLVGLLDRGHEVTVFSHRRPRSGFIHESFHERRLQERVRYVQPAGGGARLDVKLTTVLEIARTSVAVRFLAGDSRHRIGGIRSMLLAIRALRRAPRPDLVHCHFGDLALGYRFARALWRVPLVASFYGYDVSKYPLVHGYRVYEPLFREAAAIVALGPRMADRLASLGCPAQRLEIVGIGVDTTRFRFRERSGRNDGGPVRLLTVARLVEKKGIEFALEAIARVRSRHGNLRYDIIGEGPRRRALEDMADRLGLGDRVFFHGPRTEMGVQKAMQDADLFLLPSVTAADGDQEGTPTVLMEASSVGMPILSTRHSDIPEVVIDGVTGYLVSEGDAVALAERLGRLLDDPSSWASLGRAGRHHVARNYDQTVLSERLETVYRAALESHSAPGA